MVLENYGLRLARLTADKIEMVRQHRNAPEVQRFMVWRGHITPAMQQRWFASVDNDRNYYFVLNKDGQDIGLMNIKDIDREAGTGEKGSLIWDTASRGQHIGTKASLMLLDFAFDTLCLECVRIHVLRSNPRSLAMYAKFGFVPTDSGGGG